MSGRRGRRSKKPKKDASAKVYDEFWGDPSKLPEFEPSIALVRDPSAVMRSLGRPPLRGQETMASHYFTAVAERSVSQAGLLAVAGHLIEPEELFGG